MKIQQQVISLELAQKLKKLGCKQDSLWWWIDPNIKGLEPYLADHKKKTTGETYPAYSVAELGEMLPRGYASHKLGDEWYCLATEKDRDCSSKSEANARAKMLIYLLENGILNYE